MNRYVIFTLGVFMTLGLGTAQFAGFDFLNFGDSGELLSPVAESVKVAPDEVSDVGTIPTEKPVFGIISGELETQLVGGYAVQTDATVVAVPKDVPYRNGMGTYSKIFATLSSEDVPYSITTEYRINCSGDPQGTLDCYAYKTTPFYNPTSEKTVFVLAYNVTSGTSAVDLYLEREGSVSGIMGSLDFDLNFDESDSDLVTDVNNAEIPAFLSDILSQA